jgi:hypothetical protein
MRKTVSILLALTLYYSVVTILTHAYELWAQIAPSDEIQTIVVAADSYER